MDSLITRSVTPKIEVKIQCNDNLWLTELDQSDFEDAVINLVINARDAITAHGNLTFETSNCLLDTAFCEKKPGTQPGEYVKLSVSDSGIGMTPEQQEHIFEPFYTTKEQGTGTGLGLSMVYSFVERSGGYIEVHSKPGSGTTFNLYLPRTKKTIQPEGLSESNTPSPAINSKTILVVDDEPALLSPTKSVLSSHGYKVLTALNGHKAMELINNEADIDLVFSDVIMPGSISGYELAKQALTVRPDLKILLTSGYTGEQNGIANKNPHEFTLLDKPYNHNEMLKRIKGLLED
jgi:CheY-like chemotaxis protein